MASDKIDFQNPLDLPDGFILLGDSHQHPGPPNPSAIDLADDQDGLHIIVGNIESPPRYNRFRGRWDSVSGARETDL